MRIQGFPARTWVLDIDIIQVSAATVGVYGNREPGLYTKY